MSVSVRPQRRQPTRLPHPWDSPGKSMGWVAISFSNAWKWKVKVKSLSHVWLCATPWTAAHQAPPSMGFARQEYWSGVPLPSPSDPVSSGIFIVRLEELQGDSQRLSLKMVWSTGSESSEDHLKTGDQYTRPFLTHPAYAEKYHNFQRCTIGLP